MSNKLVNLAYSRAVGAGPLKAVLVRLANIARDDGTSIYPAVSTISLETAFSERTVRAALKQLRASGLLVVVATGGGRRKATNYRIDIRSLEAQPAVKAAYGAGFAGDQEAENPAAPAPFIGETLHVVPENPAAPAPKTLLNLSITPSERGRSPETASPAVPPAPAGGAIAPSVGKMIWSEAIALLSPYLPEARSRSLIGRWCKRATKADDLPQLLTIIRATVRAGTADPVPYIEASLNEAFPPPPDPAALSDKDWSIRIQIATDRKEWLPEWGPRPGDAKCFVPAHLITDNLLFAMRFAKQKAAA